MTTFKAWGAGITGNQCFEEESKADQALLKDYHSQRSGLMERMT
jgi:hypothetical protein